MNKLKLSLSATAAVLLLASGSAFAQVSSGAGNDVTMTATLQESLTVTLDQAAVTFALTSASATNPGNTAVNATTSWVLAAGRTSVSLFAYFDELTAALTAGGQNVASSQVSALVGWASVGAFTNTVPFGPAGVTIFTQAITGANLTGTNTSAVTFNIDLSSTPNLAAAAYGGTLHFQAQATT